MLAAGPASAIVGAHTSDAFDHVGRYGVQIADNWVLTARHIGWSSGATFRNAYGTSTVAQVYHAASGAFPLDDLSLLRLQTPVLAPQLALLATELPPGVLDAPFDVTMVSGRLDTGGPRQYAHTVLQEVAVLGDPDDDTGPLPAASVNWLLAYPDGYQSPYVVPGDSGSALLLGHVEDSVGAVLAGIAAALNIHTVRNPAQVEYESAYVQIAAYRGWIDATLSADSHDAQQAQWWLLSPVPEPASAAQLLAGVALWLALRRRQEGAAGAG